MTSIYVYPQIGEPAIYLTTSPTIAYTYTTIHTPIKANEIAGSLPIANTTFKFGENNAMTTTPLSNSSYIYTSTTASLTINDMVTDVNGFGNSNATTGDMVLGYNYGSVTLETSLAYTKNQNYTFTRIQRNIFM